MKRTILLLLLLLPVLCFSQDKPCTYLVSVYSNAVSLPAVKFSPLHPGIQVGFEKIWKEKKRFTLAQNFRLGYFYQRLVHHGIPLYTQIGYKYRVYKKLNLAAFADAGYIHTFGDNPTYKLNSDGEYVRTARAGKAHITFGYSIMASWAFSCKHSTITPFIQHQFWMMTPFVKSYVPLMPNSAFHAGVYFTINK